jgi:cardiolipin synthase A/B
MGELVRRQRGRRGSLLPLLGKARFGYDSRMAAAGRTSSQSSAFHWLHTGREGLQAMLSAIGGSRRSIRLETYIFDDTTVGQTFRNALLQASARGVQVTLLVDAVGSLELPDSFWQPLREAGARVLWFNPISLKRIGYRDHRKILVIDDQEAIIGGFNVAKDYDGDGVHEGWRDLGLRVEGSLANDLGESCDAMFARAGLRHKRLQRLRRTGVSEATTEHNWRLLLTGPGRGHQLIKRALAADLAGAREVNIASAYFLPAWRLRREMRRVPQRGGRVRLILAGKSDVNVSRYASRRLYQGLLRAGVQIYEYQPQILHAKLFILDQVVYVGSANLDVRGLAINYEYLVRVRDEDLAAGGREIVRSMLEHCRRIEPGEWAASRTFAEKLMENVCFFVLARLDPYLAHWQWRRLTRSRPPALFAST